MKRFTDAGRMAIAAKNHYAALSLALMIPDICGSLEDPGTGKSQKRYERWFSKWAEPKFTHNGKIFLSSSDCFQLRCSLIHSGSTEIDSNKRDVLQRIEFFDDSGRGHLVWLEGNTYNGVKQPSVLVLVASKFSETMYQAAEEWDAASANEPSIQALKTNLTVIRSKGFVMQGIQFG